MMDSMYLEIDELFNEAIITNTPVLIVEGINDIEIYEKLSINSDVNTEVYAIENIKDFSEGCDQVISAIETLEQIETESYKLSDYILGIIDKDVRDFRNEMPSFNAILTLKQYSIESHFVSVDSVAHIASISNRANSELISQDLCHRIMDRLENKLLELYYFSLEALKNSIDKEYEGYFCYSYNTGRIDDSNTQELIKNKESELDFFANSLSLTPCLETLKKISNGKWLLDRFVLNLINELDNLSSYCKDGKITKCQPCQMQNSNKCLYRLKEGITQKPTRTMILSNISGDEFRYIENRIRQLKTTIQ